MANAEAPRALGLPAAGVLGVALGAVFWATGTLFPSEVPSYATSPLQITGMSLMLILLPPYLLAAQSISRERALELVEQLRGLLPDPAEADVARARVRGALRGSWKVGAPVGLLFGVLNNANPIDAVVSGEFPAIDVTITLGQMLLWLLIGLLLAARVATTLAFRRLGDRVTFDLFALEKLRPLARAGVIDVVIIAGALMLSPLQALDAEFRWYNYHFALIVALPAAAFFLTYPLLGVHRRIRRERDRRVAGVDALLASASSTGADAEATIRLETLLAHRDRLATIRTWPFSGGLLSRVAFYMVLPPMAWAGAALVERLLEALLQG